MKFALVALAGAALADRTLSLMERQVQTIVDVINNINTQTTSLDTAIKGYNGGTPNALLSASQKVLDATNQGATTVNGATSISLADALTVQNSVQTLTTNLQTTINDLIAKKSQLVAAGAGGTTQKSLQDQLTAAKALATAISSKVPSDVAQLAQQLSQGIQTNIQKGIDAFQGTGTGSSSGGGAASTTSAARTSGGSSGGGSRTSAAGATSARTSSPATFTGAAVAYKPAVGALAIGAAAVFAL